MANSNHGTHDGTPEEVTWFPSLITEHDIDEVTAHLPEPADHPSAKDRTGLSPS